MGVDLETLGRLIGTPLELLLGVDILLKYQVLLDLPHSHIQFSLPDGSRGGRRVPLRLTAGVPLATCLAQGTAVQAVLDTGSKLSYLPRSLTQDLAASGIEQGFYPGLGTFETEVYAVPCEIGGLEVRLRCGVLPAAALGPNGAQGILGVELLQKFEILLNLPAGELGLRQPA